jgi:hypothetical protein
VHLTRLFLCGWKGLFLDLYVSLGIVFIAALEMRSRWRARVDELVRPFKKIELHRTMEKTPTRTVEEKAVPIPSLFREGTGVNGGRKNERT